MTRTVVRAGITLELTVKQLEVREYLLRHPGHVVSREMLTRDVWRIAARATPFDNAIDVTMARLRRKVDDRSTRSCCTPFAGWDMSSGRKKRGRV